MNKPSKLLWLVMSAIASASTPAAASQPNDANSVASGLYTERLREMLATTGWRFESATDTKQIARVFRSNQAKAQIQFSSPGIYHGRVSKVIVDNQGTSFIVDQGLDTAVTVLLDKYQAWPWKTLSSKAEVGGIQSASEFAANFNPNQELYFQCRRVEFGLGVYLTNCLAFPAAVAATKSVQELISNNDVSESFEDLIKTRASEGWARPNSIQNLLKVTLQVDIDVDGGIKSVNIVKSSGSNAYDNSVIAAIKNIGSLHEIKTLSESEASRYRSIRLSLTPNDLSF